MVDDFKKMKEALKKRNNIKVVSKKIPINKKITSKRVFSRGRATLYLEEPNIESVWEEKQRFFNFGRGNER